MRINRIIFFLSLLINSVVVFGQNEITWTESFRTDRKQRLTKMIGADSSYFFVLQEITGKTSTWELHVYNKETMATKSISAIELPSLPGVEMRMDDVLLFGERLLLITTAKDEGAELLSAYGTWLSTEGKPADFPVLLGEQSTGRKRVNNQFGFELSGDMSKLLIFNESEFERKANERFTLKVMDADLETVWQKDLELPYSREIFEINQYAVDYRGHVYMMSGITNDKLKKKEGDRPVSDKRYVIISYDPDQNKVKEFEVSLENKWVISTTFALADDGDLVIGGFYSNNRYFSIAGSFFFRIDGDTKAIEAKGLHPFSKEVLAQFMSERKAEKGLELEDFYFDHFMLREDGGASMVAEQYYVTQRFQTDIASGRQEIQYFYHFNDVLIVDINAEGEINWVTKVAKIQVSMNDKGPYSSYALSHVSDTLCLVFNDNRDNVALLAKNPEAKVNSFSTVRRSSVTLVKVFPDGTQARTALLSSKDQETLIKPKVNISEADGAVFIYSQLRKNVRFGRIHFGLGDFKGIR